MIDEANGIRKLRSRRNNNHVIKGRNKDLAPNGIKKTTPVKKVSNTASKTISLRKSPRKSGRRIQTSSKKQPRRQSEIE